jgi:hypothetical protein
LRGLGGVFVTKGEEDGENYMRRSFMISTSYMIMIAKLTNK